MRRGVLWELPEDAFCPIAHQIMEDPVVCADGHSYERRFLEAWFARGNRTSPKTNLPLSHMQLVENIALRNMIEALQLRLPVIEQALQALSSPDDLWGTQSIPVESGTHHGFAGCPVFEQGDSDEISASSDDDLRERCKTSCGSSFGMILVAVFVLTGMIAFGFHPRWDPDAFPRFIDGQTGYKYSLQRRLGLIQSPPSWNLVFCSLGFDGVRFYAGIGDQWLELPLLFNLVVHKMVPLCCAVAFLGVAGAWILRSKPPNSTPEAERRM